MLLHPAAHPYRAHLLRKWWRFYYFVGSQRIAMRYCAAPRAAQRREGKDSAQENRLVFLLSDHLGGTNVVVSSSGDEQYRLLYRAFGEQRNTIDEEEVEEETLTDYRFTGQLEDRYINLIWMGSRWYDPALGRFAQADSIIPQPGNPLDWDRYAYVRNSPINNTDPSGNITCEDSFDYCNPKDMRLKLNWFEFNIITGIWVIPKAIASTMDVSDSPIELITRAILGEEPGKLYGPNEDDADGVAWAIRNRHDSGYYKKNGDLDWYYSANSEIYGNRTPRAKDPIGSGFWKSWKDSVAAYNRARSIANKVLHSSANSDITGGNGRWGWWADAVPPEGQQANIINTNYGKKCTNCLDVQRTRFTYAVFRQVGPYPSLDDHWIFAAAVCVNTASVCN